jgi:RNA polymerase sigma factor (sigma-70 family)
MIGPTDAAFPSTRLSVLRAVASPDPGAREAALEVLSAIYWRPVYARYRLKWNLASPDAQDLTQDFFARAAHDDLFRDFDPARGRFRTYLRVCADRLAANARRDRRRLKRGGGVAVVSLDVAGVERDLAQLPAIQSDDEADAWFDREWIRALFADAVERLRSATAGTSREIRFTLLSRYDLEPQRDADRPGYRALADEFHLPLTQVTNHLAWARRELRRLLLERLHSLSASDAEFRDQAEAVLGREGG